MNLQKQGARELERYNRLIIALREVLDVREQAPFIHTISPEQPLLSRIEDRPLPLCLSSLIHGNETGGLGILNDFMEFLLNRPDFLEFPIGVAIGNPEAGQKGIRYVGKDLNRSFGLEGSTSYEPQRAALLASMLMQSWYYIDFHQTRKKNTSPFFIFPFYRQSYCFARDLAPEIPVVTHWEGAFSAEGSCSDEFHSKKGGAGITIETGQNGQDPYQSGFGFSLIIRATNLIRRKHGPWKDKRPQVLPAAPGNLYTWAATKTVRPEDKASLREGWYNFCPVKEGEVLGSLNGQPLRAESSGCMLFPQYPDPTLPPPDGPTELYRIIKKIGEEGLPEDSSG